MKERPILFNGDMVRAVLAGRKTQTRRVVKCPPFEPTDKGIDIAFHTGHLDCPFGQPGDRLWVKETFWHEVGCCQMPSGEYDSWYVPKGKIAYCTDFPEKDFENKEYPWNKMRKRPSVHMPRWASRILLDVTDVRVQRLQEISARDAIAEGIFSHSYTGWDCMTFPYPDIAFQPFEGSEYMYTSPIDAFKALWNSISDTWNDNPWVWAVSFKVVQP